ncbi:hypothetical protein MMC13_007602 [Lambiella insularis]|nr:hypothetical protein [Lambiella insularis]
MGLSKSTRIGILLGIDSAFFLLELVVGYAVHSLALVADSFHMLNDVLSLCVGLWAVKVANQKTSSKMYTYGWQRAETLGALVNGVFLVALCLSIFLEAIQRFVEPQTVTNPRLVLIVGCFGLLSNILGLFLFHEHGHSHGGAEHGHAHGQKEDVLAAEEGHSHADVQTSAVADEGGNVADVLPQSTIGNWPQSQGAISDHMGATDGRSKKHSPEFTKSDEDDSTAAASSSPYSVRKTNSVSHPRHRRRTSASRARFASVDDILIHPASFRNEIIAASKMDHIESGSATESEADQAVVEGDHDPSEESPLLKPIKSHSSSRHRHSTSHGSGPNKSHASWHTSHNHNQPKKASGGGGHSHGDLNMRGVFLHVMGDALGNIGVIASALIIWLSDFSWRFYSDPAISLIITIIILGSAIPLCRAASRILLQAVPAGISVDEIKEDIERLPGILGCHHLHVWQLSDTKLVASLHVQVEFDFKHEGSARYMALAKGVRHCLHEYGIHSSTIQPEFCLDAEHRHASGHGSDDDAPTGRLSPKTASKNASKAGSLRSAQDACLLECGDECGDETQCCAPAVNEAEGSDSGHAHGHSH